MSKTKALLDWRQDPAVLAARGHYDELEREATGREEEVTGLLSDIAAEEAERQEIARAIVTGDATPAALIERKIDLADKRAKLEVLEGKLGTLYKSLAAARDTLNDAEASAKGAAWAAGMAAYVQAKEKLADLLPAAIEAEGNVREIYRALGEQFGLAAGWIRGPGEAVGSAAYGHRRLTPEALTDWRAWCAECGVISDDLKKKRAAERALDNMRRLATRESAEDERRAKAEAYYRRNQPQSTRDLSPSRLVKVTMLPRGDAGDAA